jgi:hypothetical protein
MERAGLFQPDRTVMGFDLYWVTMDQIVDGLASLLLKVDTTKSDFAAANTTSSRVLGGADAVIDAVADAVTGVAKGARGAASVAVQVVGGAAQMVGAAGAQPSPTHEGSKPSEVAVPTGVSTSGSELRKIPGPFRQFRIVSHRRFVQVFRNMHRRAADVGVMTFAAVILGIQHINKQDNPSSTVTLHLALSILIPISCLPCFAADRAVFWRERSHGLDGVAFCLARMAVDSVDILLLSTVYASVYYLVSQPPVPFDVVLWPMYLLAFVCSGWGYCIAALFPPQNAMLAVVMLMVVLNGALAGPEKITDYIDGGFMEGVVACCPSRWSVMMFTMQWWKTLEEEIVFHAKPEAQGLIMAYRKSSFDLGQAFKKLPFEAQMQKLTLSQLGDVYSSVSTVTLCLQAAALRLVTIVLVCLRNSDQQV